MLPRILIKVFDYINLVSTSWEIGAYYIITIQATLGQAVFGSYMIFKLASVVYQRFLIAGKHRQADIDNIQENYRRATHDYTVGNIVYVSYDLIS